MTVKSHKLGPGSLKLGTVGSEAEFNMALRSCQVVPETDDGETLPVLSGEEVDEGDDETYALEGTVLQSYDVDSFLVWAHTFAGQVLPFRFVPDNDKMLSVVGEVKVRRVQIGGDVKERNESDFSFPGRNGMYDLVTNDEAAGAITWTPPAGPAPAPVEDVTPAWD